MTTSRHDPVTIPPGLRGYHEHITAVLECRRHVTSQGRAPKNGRNPRVSAKCCADDGLERLPLVPSIYNGALRSCHIGGAT